MRMRVTCPGSTRRANRVVRRLSFQGGQHSSWWVYLVPASKQKGLTLCVCGSVAPVYGHGEQVHAPAARWRP